MFEFKVKVGMTVKYRGEDWAVIAKSPLAGGWWIKKDVEGREVVVEALRRELSESDYQ